MTRREPIGKALHKAGLSETQYGYILRAPGLRFERTRMYEIAMACTGVAVTGAVVGVFLVPPLRDGGALGPLQLSVSIILLSMAGLLMRYSLRGRYRDSEVDFDAGELRLVRRNTRGRSQIESRIPFDQIRSIFVRRNKARNSMSTLCCRVASGERGFELVSGTEEAMSILHRRLVRDINNERGKTRAQHAAIRARDEMLDIPSAGGAVA